MLHNLFFQTQVIDKLLSIVREYIGVRAARTNEPSKIYMDSISVAFPKINPLIIHFTVYN